MRITESRFPVEGGWYAEVVGFSLHRTKADSDLAGAQAFLKESLRPASKQHCMGWLALMQAAFPPRRESPEMAETALKLYAASLQEYPADVARLACSRFAKGQTERYSGFFPTLGELIAECEELATTRHMMADAYRPRIALPDYGLEISRPAPSTPDDAAAIKAMGEEFRKEMAKLRKPKPVMPANHGRPDETGITPLMRETMERMQWKCWREKGQLTA